MSVPPLRRTLALAAAAAALGPAAAEAAPGDTTLVSRASGAAGPMPDRSVYHPSISADGSVVAFSTQAENLSGMDADPTIDVYARTLAAATTSLVSAGPNPMPFLPDVGGDTDSTGPSMSADGRYVAFVSSSTNLTDDDGDAEQDVFVRDRQTGVTRLVSRDDGIAGAAADDDSRRPSISADGRYIAFESDATNLSNADEDGASDIFVRDTQLHQTTLISHRELDGGDDDSTHPEISGDGKTVAFYSKATNLSDEDADDVIDVFAAEFVSPSMELISRATGGATANAGPNTSAALAVSANGQRIAFVTSATNLAPGDGPSVDVFLRDRVAGTTSLVSPGNGASFQPSMSADGTRVAFHSYATNLHPDDVDISGDVYVHDLTTGTISLESRTSAGAKANGPSGPVAISADGTRVMFISSAVNLGANMWPVAFARELPVAAGAAAGGDGAGGASSQGTHPTAPADTPRSIARAGRLKFGRGASTCLRRKRLVLQLKLVGATPGVRITGTHIRVGGARIVRYRGKASRRPVVRKLGRTPVTVRITATTSIGTKLKLTKRFRVCRAR